MLIPRLQINLFFPNFIQANKFKIDIESILINKKVINELEIPIKISLVESISDKNGMYEYLTHLFLKSNNNNFILDNIKTFLPQEIKGKISFHLCPGNNEILDWQGCKNDNRANYREIIF